MANSHPCNGCLYFWNPACNKDSAYAMCLYWEIEDKLRPCKPGPECTVRKDGKINRRRSIDIKYPRGRRDSE